ncbi:hypothetical protein [Actinomadura sp. GTD37]|uniref:hypothetical protein n=1 Tax=Actinomadura sp. GTD37 TaxID=1778030 RepID=UPI0035C00CF4
MPDSTTRRLGAALVFGGTAGRCVHVHTGPAGIAVIRDRLVELHDADDADDADVTVVSVLGVAWDRGVGLADVDEWAIPADAVEDLVVLAMGLNQARDGVCAGERRVRERVAGQIEARRCVDVEADVCGGCACRREDARIARGEP